MSKQHHPNQPHAQRNGAKGNPKQTKDTMQVGRAAERNEERSSASGFAGEMVERLQDGTAAVVDGISELAGSLKQEAVQDLAAAKEVVGDTVDKVGEVIKDAQEAVVEAGEAVVTSVKRNPMPAALAGFGLLCTGAGVTWMVMSSKSSSSNGARGGNGQARTQQGAERKQPGKRVQSSVSAATGAAGRKLKGVGQGISTRGRQLGQAAQKSMRENPLATGATLAAVGAALGLALPITRQEDEWLGEGRDEIVDKAEELARGAINKVENVTKAVTR